jgi:antitoxin (DNA-binding transcriptional repressor) of toxin-antitoxin stability system
VSLPKLDFRGQRAKVNMMELRANPGELIDRVSHGLTVDIEKQGKRVAVLGPPQSDEEGTTIYPNGAISGPIPLTFRRALGSGGY